MSISIPNIYDYKDPVQFLEAHYKLVKDENPKFSIRNWCKVLEITSPELLVGILKKKKKIPLNLVKNIVSGLNLDSSEKTYLEIIIKLANEKSITEKQLLERILSEVAQLRGTKILVEDASVFSHWVHMAILTMSRMKNFACTRDSIRDYLLDSVSQVVIDESIERLLRLKLVDSDENGNLKRAQDHTTSKNDAFQKAPHTYFEQVSELAKKGSQVPADEREFQCFSLAIKHDQIPMFKEVIRNFRAKVASLAETENSDQVYQFNVQFFPLTNQVPHSPIEMKQEFSVSLLSEST